VKLRLAILLVAACGGSKSAPLGERVGPLVGAAMTAADKARAPWRCAAPDTPTLPDDTLTVGAHKWKLAGHAVVGAGKTIAVVGDAGGAAPATIAALGRLRGKLDAAAPDIVIALGGMGANQGELEATLGTLAGPWLVVAMPGDLEPAEALAKATLALRQKGAAIVDGRLARRIELGGVTVATIPGGGPSRVVAGADGCGYRATDVATAVADLAQRPGLRVVASFEAPRDTIDGEATGDLPLAPDAAVDIVLSPRSSAALPRSGTRDGKAVRLGPGTLDATARLPSPHAAPTLGILSFTDERWSWRVEIDAK
jgi:hypothetical protein